MEPTDHATASLEAQPHHLFQMQDKHKTTAAMKKKNLKKKDNLEIIKQQGSHP